jgi:hypothetical protein
VIVLKKKVNGMNTWLIQYKDELTGLTILPDINWGENSMVDPGYFIICKLV